jgi:hypothetical protein
MCIEVLVNLVPAKTGSSATKYAIQLQFLCEAPDVCREERKEGEWLGEERKFVQ